MGLYRTCTKCFLHKPVEDFPWKNRLMGKRHAVCKECYRQRSNQWYYDHKNEHMVNVLRNRQDYKQTAQEYAHNWLCTHPCVDCGQSDPLVLEFDHVRGKEASLTEMIRQGYALERVKAEIARCEVRCAKCHRLKTARERGWYSKTNPDPAKARAKAYLETYLSEHPCVDCGERNPVVLDFDHVRGRKFMSLSLMANRGYGAARLQEEIAKCEVRCANCHRRRTANERNWYRAELA